MTDERGTELGRDIWCGNHPVPPPSNVTHLDKPCAIICAAHGPTNHIVEYRGLTMCAECNPLVTRKAMAENVPK